jgi:hypothetical protein
MSDIMEGRSIEELATLFEQRAKAARDAIKPATPNMRLALLRERANTWEEAARIVRATVIVTKGRTTPRIRASAFRTAPFRAPPPCSGWRAGGSL